MQTPKQTIVTLNLNTAIDRVIQVPNFAIGAHLPGQRLSQYPAGKGINVSRALARLQRRSVATGFVGQGELEMFERFLAEEHADRITCQLLAVRGDTRQNITLIDPIGHTDTHIREAGFTVTPQDVTRILGKMNLLARPGVTIVVSGSLPPGMTPADLQHLLASAVAAKAKILLDADGQLLRDLLNTPVAPDADPPIWLLKPNLSELAHWAGHPVPDQEAPIVQVARKLTNRAQAVLVTRGGQGALWVTQHAAWRGHIDLDPAMAINTVGCGDCLLAGVLDASMRSADPPAMLAQGLAVATANTLQTGAASFDPKQVAHLASIAHVEAI